MPEPRAEKARVEKACPYCGNTAKPRRAPSLRVCCDDCYDSLPRDLPGNPKWRSDLRWAYSGSGSDPWDLNCSKRVRVRTLSAAITEYLTAHAAMSSRPGRQNSGEST